MDGLLSQSRRSWVKEDGHSPKSGRFLGINRSVKLDGPQVSKLKVTLTLICKLPYPLFEVNLTLI